MSSQEFRRSTLRAATDAMAPVTAQADDRAPRTVAVPHSSSAHDARPALNSTRNDLPDDTRAQLVTLLQARLVDAIDLYLHAKASHWNVKGPNFIALHELFDSVASEAETFADQLAERSVQLGGTPEGSAPAVALDSSLATVHNRLSSEEGHVATVADALAHFGAFMRAGVARSDELGDRSSADLFTEISRGIDKLTWQVEAHLHER